MNPVQERWPQPIRKVLKTLMQAGFEAYLVGGCVRDSLRQTSVHDYDVATNAHPGTVRTLFEQTIPTGIRHGTITVLLDGMAVEVTTYRRETGYSDGRRPDIVTFDATLLEDLSRRDFTINAMAMGLDGNLIDPYHGQQDLTHKVIRAVGNPKERFAEDGLRMIRAIRFASVMQFHIETDTLNAMEAMSHNLQSVALERIGQEFLRITGSAWWYVSPLLANGPWLEVLPEPWPKLKSGFSVIAKSRARQARLGMVWGGISHNGKAEEWELQAASAALLCFLAKLEDEQVRHWLLRMAWTQQRRNLTMKILSHLCEDPLSWTLFQWRKAFFNTGRNAVYLASALLDDLDYALGDSFAMTTSRRIHQYNQLVHEQPIWHMGQLDISGVELLKLEAAGPAVGETLRYLVEQVLAELVPNSRDPLLALAKTKLMELNRK